MEETTRSHEVTFSAPLSPEVEFYLESRGYSIPTKVPLWRTKEPYDVPGAMFDPARVDRVIKAVESLRHTKGRWAGKPLKLDPVQIAFFIAPIFGWVKKDSQGDLVRIIREVWIEMPRKAGKMLTLDTPMLTPSGWTTMGELSVGDWVYGPSGYPVRIIAESEVHYDRDCYRVTTSDGRSVVAGGDHLWTVRDRQVKSSQKRSAWVTMTTDELIEKGLTKGIARPELRWELPRQHAIDMPAADLPVDPYTLGYWLGDGTSASATFTVGDADIEHFRAQVGNIIRDKQYGSKTAHTVGVGGGLQVALRNLGVLNNKHIPEAYLTASIEQRLALLQGLMDSDGTIDRARGKASFCGMNERLVDQFIHLARTLGFRAFKNSKPAVLNGKACGTSYHASFSVNTADMPVFRLQRKLDRIPAPKADDRRFSVSLKSIEKVESAPSKCIMVDSEDSLYLAGRDLVVTHNSSLVGALSFYMAFADKEGGAEVLLGAASKDQARLAYQPLRATVDATPALQKVGIKANRQVIEKESTGAILKPVSSRGDLAHGANIHCGLIDELHVHKSPDLLEAFETGVGARSQPIVFVITTADDGSTTSVYAQRRDAIEKICAGTLKSDHTYGVIFAMRKGDDPFDEENWDNANPLYPVTPSPEYMRSAADKAKANPTALASFLRLHLGVRSDKATRFFDTEAWKRNSGMVDETSLKGAEAYGGIDLGATSDLTALSWLFPKRGGGFSSLTRFWLPEAALEALDGRTQRMASAWVDQGWLTITPGDVTDYSWIRRKILEDAEKFDVIQIGYDRWNATQLVNDLVDDGLPMAKVPQNVAALSPALKELDRLLRIGQYDNPMFEHGNNPILRWNADNVRVRTDANGNIAPDKSTSMDKIDGIAATLNALSTFLTTESYVSAYEEHGLEMA